LGGQSITELVCALPCPKFTCCVIFFRTRLIQAIWFPRGFLRTSVNISAHRPGLFLSCRPEFSKGGSFPNNFSRRLPTGCSWKNYVSIIFTRLLHCPCPLRADSVRPLCRPFFGNVGFVGISGQKRPNYASFVCFSDGWLFGKRDLDVLESWAHSLLTGFKSIVHGRRRLPGIASPKPRTDSRETRADCQGFYQAVKHSVKHCNIQQPVGPKAQQVLQQTATRCNTLQYTATHCNTLQHTVAHRS